MVGRKRRQKLDIHGFADYTQRVQDCQPGKFPGAGNAAAVSLHQGRHFWSDQQACTFRCQFTPPVSGSSPTCKIAGRHVESRSQSVSLNGLTPVQASARLLSYDQTAPAGRSTVGDRHQRGRLFRQQTQGNLLRNIDSLRRLAKLIIAATMRRWLLRHFLASAAAIERKRQRVAS